MATKYSSTTDGSDSDDSAKQKHKTPIFIYVLTFLSTIGGFLFGYDTGVVSGAMLLIREEFSMSTQWHEAIVSVTIAAAWAFALIGGWLTDKVGRKPVILLASLVFTVGSIIMGLATSKEMLLLGRLVVGIGIGTASMSVPVYIAESALPEARGHLVTVNTLFITGGQFIAAIICGVFSTHSQGWRYMLGLAAIPACIQFIGFLGMPESPRWLVSKKKYDEAAQVLHSIRGEDFPVEDEIDLIKASCMLQAVNPGESQSVWMRVYKSQSTRKALMLGCILQAIQQLAGINTVMYYSASIIQMAGIKDVSLVIWLACGTAGVNFVCTFIGLFLVERVGRRSLTLWSLAGVVVSLIILGLGFHLMKLDTPGITLKGDCGSVKTCAECIESEANCGFCYYDSFSGIHNGSCWVQDQEAKNILPLQGTCSNISAVSAKSGLTWAVDWCPSHYSWITVTAVGVYLLFFAPGMGPMPWTINSEIYPMWARSFCNSVATSTNWMCNLLISMTFLTFTELLTKEGAFYMYAGLAALGLLILFWILPETKGKSLEEMESLFTGSFFAKAVSTNLQNVHNLKNEQLVSTNL